MAGVLDPVLVASVLEGATAMAVDLYRSTFLPDVPLIWLLERNAG
jgi:hypothetical protein